MPQPLEYSPQSILDQDVHNPSILPVLETDELQINILKFGPFSTNFVPNQLNVYHVVVMVIGVSNRTNHPHILDSSSEWTYGHVSIWVVVE